MAHLRFHVDQSMRNPARLTYTYKVKQGLKDMVLLFFQNYLKYIHVVHQLKDIQCIFLRNSSSTAAMKCFSHK